MQNDRNLFTDFTEVRKKISNGWRQLFGEPSDFNRLAYYKNPHSMLDELLVLFWIALLCATGLTMFYSAKYHISIFEAGKNQAWVTITIALMLLILGEGLKVFLAHRFLRAVFSAMFFKGLPDLILTVVMGILSFYTFMWSVDISTKGYALSTSKASKIEVLNKTGNYDTKKIDDDISSVKKSIENANKIKWHGVITGDAQEIIKRGNKTLNNLNHSRDIAVAAAQQKDAAFLSISNSAIDDNQVRLSDYGGKAEAVVAICLFLICLIERIHYRINKEAINKKEEKGNFLKLNSTANSSPITERSTIGFRRNSDVQKTVTTPITPVVTVTTAVTPVTTETVTTKNKEFEYGDKLIKGLKQAFNAELNNLKIGNGKSETILIRIKFKHEEFIKALDEIKCTPALKADIETWVKENIAQLLK